MKAYTTVALGLERLLGLSFLVMALAKAIDAPTFALQLSLYRVIVDPSAIRLVAYGTILFETFLGSALLLGVRLRGLTSIATFLLLVFFSGLVGYAWRVHGLADCGCFGKLMKMSPQETMVKNLVMAIVLFMGWDAHRRLRAAATARPEGPRGLSRGRLVAVAALTAGAGLLAIVSPAAELPAAPARGGTEAPASAFDRSVTTEDGATYDLGTGRYLVALLNAGCEHCRASVPTLNEYLLYPELPTLVALMMGEEQEFRDFRDFTNPQFPIHVFAGPIEFFDLMRTMDQCMAPPCFVLIADGAPVAHWGETPPSIEALLAYADPPAESR